MKLKVLKCPECGANIELEENRDFCFCSYCGCKIILDSQKQEITINKNIKVNKTVSYTNHYINEAEVIEAKAKVGNSKRNVILGIAIPLVFVLLFVSFFASIKQGSNKEEEKLQSIVDEVMIAIENGDFEEAYIKANSIYYTADWSDDIGKKWDKTREALLKQIKKAEKEATGKGLFGIG